MKLNVKEVTGLVVAVTGLVAAIGNLCSEVNKLHDKAKDAAETINEIELTNDSEKSDKDTKE